MKNKTVSNWTRELASKDGKYTGGSTVAMIAAVSASLAQFIFELQSGKKRFKNKENQIQKGIKKARSLNKDLLELAEIDADAFNPVLSLYKLPKDTEEEKVIREKKLNEGLANASKPPFKMILKIDETVNLYQQLVDLELKGTIVEDITIGLNIALAAVKNAKISSMINIKDISEQEFKEEITVKVEEQYQMTLNKIEKLIAVIMDK